MSCSALCLFSCDLTWILMCVGLFLRAKSPGSWPRTWSISRKTCSWRRPTFTGPSRTRASAPTEMLTATGRPIPTWWLSKWVSLGLCRGWLGKACKLHFTYILLNSYLQQNDVAFCFRRSVECQTVKHMANLVFVLRHTCPCEAFWSWLLSSCHTNSLSSPLQVSCQEWGQVLLRNKEWDAMLEHTLMAWRSTSELPQWDTASHNAVREQCYGILAAHSLTALQHYRPEPNRGRELLRRYIYSQLWYCLYPQILFLLNYKLTLKHDTTSLRDTVLQQTSIFPASWLHACLNHCGRFKEHKALTTASQLKLNKPLVFHILSVETKTFPRIDIPLESPLFTCCWV